MKHLRFTKTICVCIGIFALYVQSGDAQTNILNVPAYIQGDLFIQDLNANTTDDSLCLQFQEGSIDEMLSWHASEGIWRWGFGSHASQDSDVMTLYALNGNYKLTLSENGGGNTEKIILDPGNSSNEASITIDGKNVVTNDDNFFVGSSTEGIPVEGAGSRMMWYPDKQAFRAGRVLSTQWDESFTGKYSAAMGLDTIASGYYSFAAGRRSEANASYSTALGNYSIANGANSVALGGGNTGEFADGSLAGYQSFATGVGSVALASGFADGQNSVALGGITSGDYSCSMGGGVTYGMYSVAMGLGNALGNYSVSAGNASSANGDDAIAIGAGITIDSPAAAGFGRYNENKWVSGGGDAVNSIFEIGIGTSVGNPLNVMTAYKDGGVEIGKSTTDTGNENGIPLTIKSDGSVILSKRQGDIAMGTFGPSN